MAWPEERREISATCGCTRPDRPPRSTSLAVAFTARAASQLDCHSEPAIAGEESAFPQSSGNNDKGRLGPKTDAPFLFAAEVLALSPSLRTTSFPIARSTCGGTI